MRWLPTKTVRPPSAREPSGPSPSMVSVRITRRCSTSEASSASRVSGVSLSRNPWAASRYVRSSDSAVPDSAASRFASATREVSSATAVARSAARCGAHGQHGGHERDDEHGRPVRRPATASRRRPRASVRARCCAARSSASARAFDASRNSRSPAVSSSSAAPAQSRAAPSRAPRYSSSSGRPRRCHSCAAGSGAAGRRGRPRRPPATGPGAASRSAAPRARRRAVAVDATAAGAPRRRRRPCGARASVAVQVELGQRAAASGRAHRPRRCRPAARAVGGRPPARSSSSAAVGRLRRPGERARDAAGLQVAGEGEPVAPAALPRADQRRREQRQRRRPPERRRRRRRRASSSSAVSPTAAAGSADDVAQLGLGQRRDEHQRAPSRSAKAACSASRPTWSPRTRRRTGRRSRRRAGPAPCRGKRPAPRGRRRAPTAPRTGRRRAAPAQSGGSSPVSAASASTGRLPGVQDDGAPRRAARQGARGQRGHETGPDQRGLAGAARARHDHQRRVDQPSHQPGDHAARGRGRARRRSPGRWPDPCTGTPSTSGRPPAGAVDDRRTRRGSRAGSCARTAASSARSRGPGSAPSSVDEHRAGRAASAASASPCRPERYSASTSSRHHSSCSGSSDEQPLELRDHLGVLAQRQPGLEQGGERPGADLGQPAALRRRRTGASGQSPYGSPRQRSRAVASSRAASAGSPAARRARPRAARSRRPQGVDVLAPGLERVAGAAPDDVAPGRAPRPVRLQGAAQVHQVDLQRLACGRRPVAVPERLEDRVGADDARRGRGQHGQEQALLAAGHRDGATVVVRDLQRSEDRDPHPATLAPGGEVAPASRCPRRSASPEVAAGRLGTPARAGSGPTRRGSGPGRRRARLPQPVRGVHGSSAGPLARR